MEDGTEQVIRMPLIGEDAPTFKARTTGGIIDFPKDYRDKWVILFSHPADFTPVCTTEFIKCATIQQELQEMNTELLGLSVESIYSHIAWLLTIKERIEYKGHKNIDVDFPVIEDLSLEVSRKYGMIHPRATMSEEQIMEQLGRGTYDPAKLSTKTIRAVFIIDPQAVIRAILYYPISTGRNMDEVKRLVQALQRTDEEGVDTPENWHPGEEVIMPAPETFEKAKEMVEKRNTKCPDWFLCLK